jgi:hypothetical protein
MQISKVEVAQTLGELIKMGLVEAFTEEGQPTRYRISGRPGDDDEQEEQTPVRRVERDDRLEAASGLQIVA